MGKNRGNPTVLITQEVISGGKLSIQLTEISLHA